MELQSASPPASRSARIHAGNNPLPTDSMVSVPLSDLQPSPKDIDPEVRLSDLSISSHQAVKDDVPDGDKPAPETTTPNRGSTSRSRGTASYSSARSQGSNGSKRQECVEDGDEVDWEELEKT